MEHSVFIVPGFQDHNYFLNYFGDKFTYAAVRKFSDFLLSLNEGMAIQEGLDRSPKEQEGSLF